MKIFDTPFILNFIDRAIEEDCGAGDITSDLLIPDSISGSGKLLCKQDGIIAGLPLAQKIFHRIDDTLRLSELKRDGEKIYRGDTIAEIFGSVRSILSAERTVLNCLQHLSGIATLTNQVVSLCKNANCKICDTRKTTPGWRMLEKYAVRVGGGTNHRLSLSDGILIKDNHIKAIGSLAKAIQIMKRKSPHTLKIEVEVRNLEEAQEAIRAGADALLLDNMSPALIEEIVRVTDSGIILEASGNITPANVESYAATGVNLISMGFLTHSAQALDLSLKLE